MRRLVIGLAAAVLTLLFGLVSPASAMPIDAHQSTTTDQMPNDSAPEVHITAEHGPPVSAYAYAGIDSRTGGTSVRPGVFASGTRSTITAIAPLEQTVEVTTMTAGPVAITHGDLSALQRTHVAANSGIVAAGCLSDLS